MSKIILITDWAKKAFKCFRCMDTRNVKYEYEGKHYFSSCVTKAAK
jgi:hypothetical protein